MKYFAKLAVTLVLSLIAGALIDGAQAAKRKPVRHSSFAGAALRPKTSLKLDSRSVEALRPGRYEALAIGDEGLPATKRLYSLPENFSSRSAETETEMRYRP
jgi:hypothetical protein